MAENISITNSYLTYITNQPYVYPANNATTVPVNRPNTALHALNTGWHVIPNMLWKHFCTPKQWYEFMIKYEAYRVDGYTVSCFNMVPLTTQLAIQGNTIFTAFNNCVYALGYQDTLYETEWHNWYHEATAGNDFNLMYKEGLMQKTDTNTSYRFVLPRFLWAMTNSRTVNQWTWNDARYKSDNTHDDGDIIDGVFPGVGFYPSGLVWDPFNRPDDLKELRPGKNAINFTWERHACDENKWFNTDQMASWFPYTASGPYHIGHERPGEYQLSGTMDPNVLNTRANLNPVVNDYTIPNWGDMPIVPLQWWWQEIQKSIAPINIQSGNVSDAFLKHMNLFFAGTERECYMYGPTQCFIKMIPIIDAQSTNIECSAQIAVRTALHLSVKPRRSAIYCPTWGPLPWRAVYAGTSSTRNFMNSFVRYRTGGMRRTWQNIGDSTDPNAHPRRTPYIITSTVPNGTGQGNTRSIYTQARTRRSTPSSPIIPTAPPPPYYDDPRELTTNEIMDPIYPPMDQLKANRV